MDLAIQAKSKPTHVELPPVYKRYASVFSEEEAQQFLPSCTWNHAINFKDGAPDAIDCKVYPMTHTEDKALDEFIDEQLAKGYSVCQNRSSVWLFCIDSSVSQDVGSL